jgi:DNA-binding NarL/FixJ family response regulator
VVARARDMGGMFARFGKQKGPVWLSMLLTEREMEILSHIAKGRTNKEIAAQIGVKIQAVRNANVSIYKALGVGNRTEAALRYLERRKEWL